MRTATLQFSESGGSLTGPDLFTELLGPATTQNLVVKFDGEFTVEFWWKMFLTIFPSERSSKISFQTSPEVRHQFRRKLRQLHSGNRWCLNCVFLFVDILTKTIIH